MSFVAKNLNLYLKKWRCFFLALFVCFSLWLVLWLCPSSAYSTVYGPRVPQSLLDDLFTDNIAKNHWLVFKELKMFSVAFLVNCFYYWLVVGLPPSTANSTTHGLLGVRSRFDGTLNELRENGYLWLKKWWSFFSNLFFEFSPYNCWLKYVCLVVFQLHSAWSLCSVELMVFFEFKCRFFLDPHKIFCQILVVGSARSSVCWFPPGLECHWSFFETPIFFPWRKSRFVLKKLNFSLLLLCDEIIVFLKWLLVRWVHPALCQLLTSFGFRRAAWNAFFCHQWSLPEIKKSRRFCCFCCFSHCLGVALMPSSADSTTFGLQSLWSSWRDSFQMILWIVCTYFSNSIFFHFRFSKLFFSTASLVGFIQHWFIRLGILFSGAYLKRIDIDEVTAVVKLEFESDIVFRFFSVIIGFASFRETQLIFCVYFYGNITSFAMSFIGFWERTWN